MKRLYIYNVALAIVGASLGGPAVANYCHGEGYLKIAYDYGGCGLVLGAVYQSLQTDPDDFNLSTSMLVLNIGAPVWLFSERFSLQLPLVTSLDTEALKWCLMHDTDLMKHTTVSFGFNIEVTDSSCRYSSSLFGHHTPDNDVQLLVLRSLVFPMAKELRSQFSAINTNSNTRICWLLNCISLGHTDSEPRFGFRSGIGKWKHR